MPTTQRLSDLKWDSKTQSILVPIATTSIAAVYSFCCAKLQCDRPADQVTTDTTVVIAVMVGKVAVGIAPKERKFQKSILYSVYCTRPIVIPW